ncbi:MAG: 2OG-Fe dioxygenase family protein [Nevskia sp.]|uniref:2OG-Fe dioxygenase family protein n=1 Tax=Nevskia sp. TaxID=1929292 RepID=UPI0040372D97
MNRPPPTAALSGLPSLSRLQASIAADGYAFVAGTAMQGALLAAGSLDDWPAFSASWSDLALDTFMADGGRYRRRRHAVFAVEAGQQIVREPHQPHWQGLEYNPLNGGVARWFEPVAEAVGGGASLQTILRWCAGLFGRLSPEVAAWHVEIHQFRIEAGPGIAGQPTPEGAHRDGVDHVLVLMIRRHNIVEGTTTIIAADDRELGSFTLTDPFDAALVDDGRVRHGVTPVEALDPTQPAWRDVLVVTFKRR